MIRDLIRARLRRWLGIDAELERFSDAFTQAIRLLGEQQNATAINVHEAARRITYYEEHVEAIRYAKQRLAREHSKQLIRVVGQTPS